MYYQYFIVLLYSASLGRLPSCFGNNNGQLIHERLEQTQVNHSPSCDLWMRLFHALDTLIMLVFIYLLISINYHEYLPHRGADLEILKLRVGESLAV